VKCIQNHVSTFRDLSSIFVTTLEYPVSWPLPHKTEVCRATTAPYKDSRYNERDHTDAGEEETLAELK
jgi:hypothetical protein